MEGISQEQTLKNDSFQTHIAVCDEINTEEMINERSSYVQNEKNSLDQVQNLIFEEDLNNEECITNFQGQSDYSQEGIPSDLLEDLSSSMEKLQTDENYNLDDNEKVIQEQISNDYFEDEISKKDSQFVQNETIIVHDDKKEYEDIKTQVPSKESNNSENLLEKKNEQMEPPKVSSPPQNNENNIPHITPSRRSLIPKFSLAAKGAFETPSLKNFQNNQHILTSQKSSRNNSNSRSQSLETPSRQNVYNPKHFEQFLERAQLSEMKKKKAQEEVEQNEVQIPSKKLSKKEIEAITDRLAPKTPCIRKSATTNEIRPIPKIDLVPQTPSNPKIFNRLFELSTCKKPKISEDNQTEDPVQFQSVLSSKSQHLVVKNDVEKINKVYGETDLVSKEEMFNLLAQLHIYEKDAISDNHLTMLTRIINNCVKKSENNENEMYSAQKMKKKLIMAVQGEKHHKFQNFVCSRMAIARSNEKMQKQLTKNDEEIEVQSKKKLSRDTYNRLLAPKPIIDVKHSPPRESVSLMSKSSQEILKNSKRTSELYGKSLEERSIILEQKREQNVQKLADEVREVEDKELNAQVHSQALPDFYQKLPDEIKTRKNEKTEEENEPQEKKHSYEDFQKIKSKLLAPKPKPTGWDKTIERMKLGRIERNELQEALDFRSVKPVKYISKKAQKKSEKKSLIMEEPEIDELNALDSTLGI